MHPGGVIDVSRGSNQHNTPGKKNLDREHGNLLPSCFPKIFEIRTAKLSNIFAWPLRNRRKKHIFEQFAKFTWQMFQQFFVFEILVAKFSEFPKFLVFDCFACFLPWMALPQSEIPVWFSEVAETFLLLQNSGENDFRRKSGLADIDLERMMPGWSL